MIGSKEIHVMNLDSLKNPNQKKPLKDIELQRLEFFEFTYRLNQESLDINNSELCDKISKKITTDIKSNKYGKWFENYLYFSKNINDELLPYFKDFILYMSDRYLNTTQDQKIIYQIEQIKQRVNSLETENHPSIVKLVDETKNKVVKIEWELTTQNIEFNIIDKIADLSNVEWRIYQTDKIDKSTHCSLENANKISREKLSNANKIIFNNKALTLNRKDLVLFLDFIVDFAPELLYKNIYVTAENSIYITYEFIENIIYSTWIKNNILLDFLEENNLSELQKTIEDNNILDQIVNLINLNKLYSTEIKKIPFVANKSITICRIDLEHLPKINTLIEKLLKTEI